MGAKQSEDPVTPHGHQNMFRSTAMARIKGLQADGAPSKCCREARFIGYGWDPEEVAASDAVEKRTLQPLVLDAA